MTAMDKTSASIAFAGRVLGHLRIEVLHLLELRVAVDRIVGELPERVGRDIHAVAVIRVWVVGKGELMSRQRTTAMPEGSTSPPLLMPGVTTFKVKQFPGRSEGKRQLLVLHAPLDFLGGELGLNVIENNRHPPGEYFATSLGRTRPATPPGPVSYSLPKVSHLRSNRPLARLIANRIVCHRQFSAAPSNLLGTLTFSSDCPSLPTSTFRTASLTRTASALGVTTFVRLSSVPTVTTANGRECGFDPLLLDLHFHQFPQSFCGIRF